MAWSLVTEVYSFHQKLSELCSDMTDEMFGVITTVNAERFWRCNQPSQVSQTETSKRRIQSFCLSVFLPPASLSQQHLWASITHSCQRIMCIVTLFLSYNQNTSCTWLWWSIFIVCHCFHDFPVLWSSDTPPVKVCGWRCGSSSCCNNCMLTYFNVGCQKVYHHDHFFKKFYGQNKTKVKASYINQNIIVSLWAFWTSESTGSWSSYLILSAFSNC